MRQENIYDLLSKHFLSLTTAEEELEVEQYKINHPNEYARLKTFFERREIHIHNFDSINAWDKVIEQYNQKVIPQSKKVVPMFSRFSKIAAAIVLLIGSLASVYFYLGNAAKVESKIIQVVGNGQKKVLLSDGSVAWLNENARLSYPDLFLDNERKVELSGEAFFEIVKNPDKPFIVSTNNASVKVLGTSFNVNTQARVTEVSVTTGIVQVQPNSSSNHVTLKAGYSATVNEKGIASFQTSNQNYNSWRTGVFVFNQASLETVVKDLNTFYNTKIRLSPGLNIDCTLTAHFDNTPIKDVLEVLKLTCNLSIEETREGYNILQ